MPEGQPGPDTTAARVGGARLGPSVGGPDRVVATAKVTTIGRAAVTPSKPRVTGRERFGRFVAGFGRYGVWAIPIFAVIAGALPRSAAAFSTDPQVYARYLATGRYETRELVAVLGMAVFGVVSILALAALLYRGRARYFALAGLVFGCVGSVAMLWQIGGVVIRSQRLRHDLLSGDFSKMVFNADVHGARGSLFVLGGAALLILGWILFGIAVFRTGGLSRADGVLLIISAPMLYVGGMVLTLIPVLGALLLLAAGLGIAVSAGRVVPAGQAEVPAPHYERGELRPRPRDEIDDFGLLPITPPPPPQARARVNASRRALEEKRAERGRRPRGRRTTISWNVTRIDLPGEVASPRPPANAPDSAPITPPPTPVNGNVTATSVKTGMSAKSGNAPTAGTGRSRDDNTPDRRRDSRGWVARRGRNRGPGGKGQPDRPNGPSSGRE